MPSRKSSSPPDAHPRGVFREVESITGDITFRVYRCDGSLMEIDRVHPDWNPDQREAELTASLEARCPSDRAAHQLICPVVHSSRLHVLE